MKNNYTKLGVVIDMNEGFVNQGAMANPTYNKLVPEQLRVIDKVRSEGGEIMFINEGHNPNSVEFNTYPAHCILGTPEVELIPELKPELEKEDTEIFHKNCINGMLNRNVQDRIAQLEYVKEIILMGVCADLCVADFGRTLARYLDQLDREVKIFVVESAIDTFDAPGHNREEWMKVAKMFLEQAGIIYVADSNELEKQEKVFHL